MMPPKATRLLAAGGVFLAGMAAGGAFVGCVLHRIRHEITGAEARIYEIDAIVRPYALLHLLRQEKPASAIDRLESELDVGLYTLALKAERGELSANAELRLALTRVREYRQQYPREYATPEFKQKIEALLARSSHP